MHYMSLALLPCDEGGEEGEEGVGGEEAPAQAGVHGVVGLVEVLLEEEGVQSVQNLGY